MTLFAISANAQWVITPDGVLVDPTTNKPYKVIEREGTASELYKEMLKNVHSLFTNPDNVLSTIENEMISIRGRAPEITVTGGIFRGTIAPLISMKIEFKENRMRVSAQWVGVSWMDQRDIDPYTLLVVGALKCFNKDGEIKSEKRYDAYNEQASRFIETILNAHSKADDDW